METTSFWDSTVSQLATKPYVLAVYLFGSQARGVAKPYSDADVCVVSEKPLISRQKEVLRASGSPRVDVCFFWDLPPRIRFSILKKGVLIHSKDELRLHRVLLAALREYLDLAPMLKRFLG